MNVFRKLTLRTLLKNRTRTVVTIVGIMLSTALICAITSSIASVQKYAYDFSVYNNGDWHGNVNQIDLETMKAIAASDEVDSSETVCASTVGYARVEDIRNDYKPYLFILGAGENFEKHMPIHIIGGEYPKSSDEILIPSHLLTNGMVSYRLGDTVTLDVGARVRDGGISLGQNNPYVPDYEIPEDEKEELSEKLEVKETKTYTVVGFYERPDFESYSAPGYTCITAADSEDFEKEDGIYSVWFKMKKANDVYSFLEDGDFGYGSYFMVNRDVMTSSGISRYGSFYAVLYGLAAIVIGLVIFGSVSLIYNAFAISVSERTKQFGLLSSVGATKKQLRHTVFFEAFSVSTVGIPLGIAVGLTGIGITLKLLADNFSKAMGTNLNVVPFRLCVSPWAIAGACLLALVTVLISAWIPSKRASRVSAVEAIRQNSDIKNTKRPVKTSKLTYRLFGLPGVLAAKHYKRDKKRYRATVVSLFMSIVLFVSAFSFSDYLTETVEVVYENTPYDLYYMWNSNNGKNKGSVDEINSIIGGQKHVSDSSYDTTMGYTAKTDAASLTEDARAYLYAEESSGEIEINSRVIFVDDESFKEMLADNGLDEQTFMNSEAPLAVVFNSFRLFDGDKEKYVDGKVFAKQNNEIKIALREAPEGYVFLKEAYDSDSDEMKLLFENASDPDDIVTLSYDEAVKWHTLKAGACADEIPFWGYDRHSVGAFYVYPYSLAEYVVPDIEIDKNDITFLAVSDSPDDSYEEVKKALTGAGYNTVRLYNESEYADEDRNIITILNVFAYGFIVLISLIAIANVFNTIYTNVSLRRREFAMLKSVGMSQKSFNRMINYESLIYGSRSLLAGLPVSIGVTWLIYRVINDGFTADFRLPWAAMGIAVLSVFIVVFATMIYSMSRVKKENPIDVLKNENI